MELIAQIALGVIIGGLTIALFVTGFFVWNSRQRNERLAVGLFIAGAVIVVALLVVVVEASHWPQLFVRAGDWRCERMTSTGLTVVDALGH